jgi:hypothetical protein
MSVMATAKIGRLSSLIVLLAMGLMLDPAISQPRAPFPVHTPNDEAAAAAKPVRKKPSVFKGYGSYRFHMKSICEAIKADGRMEKFFVQLDSISAGDETCAACRPLIKPMAEACRPPKVGKKAKEGAQPTATPKQREPHFEVAVLTLGLSKSLAADTEIRFETLKAIRKLVALLRSPEDKTAAERDYFSLLADYFEGPFNGVAYLEKHHAPSAGESSSAGGEAPETQEGTPVPKLDELF